MVSDAACGNVGKCCTDWGFKYDAAKCAERLKADVQQSVNNATAATGVVYNPNKAGECVSAYKAIATACSVTDAQMTSWKLACNSIWTGTRANGEPCKDDFECAGAENGTATCATLHSLDGGVSGSCITVTSSNPHGTKGAPCAGTCRKESLGTVCSGSSNSPPGASSCYVEDGLYCDESSSWKCVELVAVGGSCKGGEFCVKEAYCNSGTCAARIAVGGACASAGSNDCQDGVWCNAATKLCEGAKDDKQPCTSNSECKSTRCDNGICVPSNVIASNSGCGAVTTNPPP
jgi:hypothetical protein